MTLESVQKLVASHIAKAHTEAALSLLQEWATAYGSRNAQIAQTMISSDWKKLKNDELCGVARDAITRRSEIHLRILQFEWEMKPKPIDDEPKSPNLNILFMGANPFATSKVPLHEIFYAIQRRLQAQKTAQSYTLNEYLFTRKTDFQNKILEQIPKPNMIHFAGLGKLTKAQTEKLCKATQVANWEMFGGLIFHDRNFQSIESVNADDLGQLFQYFVEKEQVPIHTVILSAGHASLQARAIAQYVPHVIGMRHEMKQTLAIEFSDAFYSALAAGQTVPDAFERAKVFIGASIVKESIRFYMNNKLQA
jgi:hypothetical protein